MKIKSIMLTAFVALIFSAVTSASQSTTSRKAKKQPSSEQIKRLQDYHILGVVLSDLLNNKEFNAAFSENKIMPVVISSITKPVKQPLASLNLSIEELNKFVPADALINLRQRNQDNVYVKYWSDYLPTNKHILLRDTNVFDNGLEGWSLFRKFYPQAKGYVTAWLPGYSKDGRTAVLHFMMGPGIHEALGIYVIYISKNKYKILFKKIGYIL